MTSQDTTAGSAATVAAEPRPPYTVRRAIDKIKADVPIAEYARAVTALRGAGNTLRGPCPIHGGDNPESFAVYPDGGRFYCFSCQERGDVLDLYRAVEGGELHDAIVGLSMRYGVELPRRPERWHRRQDEKAKVREAATRHIAARYQERLTRLYAPLVLTHRQTPEDELRELEQLAASLWPAALAMASRRVSGEE